MLKKLQNLMANSLFWARFNLFLTFFWIAFLIFANFTGLVESTALISNLSFVALILSSQTSWLGSRADYKADIRDPVMPTKKNPEDLALDKPI